MIKKKFLLFFLMVLFLFLAKNVLSDSWKEEKSEHFIVRYYEQTDVTWVKRVLREAERLYDKVADKIGYARYHNFWTWDERVVIFVYPDEATFVRETGQPPWARGGAVTDHSLLHSRMIVTFYQEKEFFDGLLPHEIAHLVLSDFIGFDKTLALWFEEGVAKWMEEGQRDIIHRIMQQWVQSGRYIPFNELLVMDIRRENDSEKAALFYAQSVCMIDFLIRKYGSNKFGQLCRNLKSADNFEAALKKTYPFDIDSMMEFEKKWLRYMGE